MHVVGINRKVANNTINYERWVSVGNKQNIILDTSVLMEDIGVADKLMREYEVLIPYVILQELDNLKDKNSYKARSAIRFIDRNYDKFKFVKTEQSDKIKNDDAIIHIASEYNCKIATFDICMKVKCKAMGIDLVEVDKGDSEEYKGYKEIYTNKDTEEDIARLYKDRGVNVFDMLENQYLLIRDEDGNLVDKMRYVGGTHTNFNNKNIKSKIIGGVKPLDEYQSCLIDSLINNDMSMVKGKAGSGKTLISLAYAFSMIEKGEYDKLIVFSNPLNSRNSARLGFYPGTRNEKILDSFVGSMLASKLGGLEAIYQLIGNGQLELLPFSDIRGYDTTGMKAIIYIVEAQNLSVDLMRLAIQRVADGCKLIIDGDYTAQVDSPAYEGSQNGMRRVSEIFRGQDFYGEVELQNIYRSKMAKIANKMQ